MALLPGQAPASERDETQPGLKIGPFEFVAGVTRGHFTSLLIASFFTICLMTLVGNLQPYLLNAVLHVPLEEQGQVSGNLGFVNELVVILFIGLVGVASDKVGRRRVYAAGFFIMTAAYALYPLATSVSELYVYRMLFAVAAACVSGMLGTILADYPLERARGKLVGACFVLNGLGVAVLVTQGEKLPKRFTDAGFDAIEAGQFAYWSVAALCCIVAFLVAFGLRGGAPAQVEKREPWFTTLRIGLNAARDPRVLLAYFAAMVSRGDLAIISTFFLLWISHAGVAQGMSPADALARGSILFLIVQVTALLWAIIVTFLIDRINRVLALSIAMSLAAASYMTVGMIDDPLGDGMKWACVFLGIGEMSGVLAAQSLIGQVAPTRGRGAVVGMFGVFGAVGILASLKVGGHLFDSWRPSAPYFVMGVAAAVLMCGALWVYFATRNRPLPAAQVA